MISYNTADIIFGYTDCHPGSVFDRHLQAYTQSWDPARRQELRLLMTTARVFTRYRSREVETVVRMCCSRFLEHIYLHTFEAGYKELSFLLAFIWHHRTVENERDLAIFDKNNDFCSRFRQRLFEKGFVKPYQASLL